MIRRGKGRSSRQLAALACAAAALLAVPAGGADESAAGARTPPPENVTPEIELAILRGLNFLVKAQSPDGSWTTQEYAYPVAMTALSGMALLASGSTATRGPCALQIRRAEEFLLSSQDSDGVFTTGDEERPMYGHSFTMAFLAQVLGEEESLERRAEIREALRKAVLLAHSAQTDDGGWYYRPNYRDSEGTLTVTVMQGLRACRDAGIHVPKEIIDRGVAYIEASKNQNGSVRYKIRSSEVREGTTCAALVALWSAGRYTDDPTVQKVSDYIERYIRPRWGSNTRHTTYVQYYLGQAKFLLGGDRWSAFYRTEARLLAASQNADGSWLVRDEMSQHGVGRIYATAVALIILQLPYNRLPIFQR